jgi:general secretion pathway protein K
LFGRRADAADQYVRKISAMKSGNSRRGMILVTVLWSISLLSALAMAASVTFRGYAGVMALERDRVQGEALVTAGLETAAGIVDASRESPVAEFETTTALGTGAARIQIHYDGGRIDIGKAPAEVLASMLLSIGVPKATALDVAKRIVERRGPGAATDLDNQSRATNVTPNPSAPVQPLTGIGQLQAIPGMTPDWIAAIAPLTTEFGDQTVNPLTAPAGVIAALPGIDSQRAAAFLGARRGFPKDVDQLVRMLAPAQQYLAVKPQRVATVDIAVALASGYSTRVLAKIVVLPLDSQPYRVLVWSPVPNSGASIDAPSIVRR